MVRPWVGWLCILIFISMVFYLYLSINAPIIRNPYILPKKDVHNTKESHRFYNSELSNNKKIKDCNSVHIAIVCAGYKSTVNLVTTVKSIIFYRTRPLHFHFLVDNIALQTLNILFTTWNLPHVTISYYKTEEWIPKISWIPNSHYSGVYGLLKIILPDAINESKIMVFDTDVTVFNDVSILWDLFQNFNKDQVIGLVENQSNWYLRSLTYSRTPWPALGKGFNTGVILMDLQKLRTKRFSELWEKTTKYVLKEIPEVTLADQDVINAVLKYNPKFVYVIDCTWNVQLSDRTLSDTCYNNVDQINVVHWNSPKKQNVINKYAQDFKKMHQVFVDLDGSLLRRRLFRCHLNEETKEINETDPCLKFKAGANIIYRTHIFFLEYEYTIVNPYDVFVATQCSIDRIALLEELSKNWAGVISVALYLTDAEVQSFVDFIQSSSELRDRKNIAYHIVYKEKDFYPVNYLRNVAMKYMKLPYVFQLDIDFLPQIGLYQNLMNHIIQQNLTEFTKVAFVVPAFETQRYRFTFPSSKEELLKYLNYGILYSFRYHVWSQGHASTNYTLYKNATKPYKVSWEPNYEPYIVVSKSSPIYDSRFIGFGWNKVSYITHLTAVGYEYIVLPDTFIIHRPHAPSRDIEKFRSDVSYRRCLKTLKDEFINDLLKKYGDTAAKNLEKIFAKEDKNVQNNSIQNLQRIN